ncbi:MAG TPA: 2,3-bisphosphoglycerate-independent phosphoglycerate mutase [Tenericutes bacterium]|jgi:2,3-bisphosphoglycerate-independent phosphoglycerate mutase|nr:2,3-bisphosphoglycerate-independent phosphoglycerate mutase [Mycoplasmatota bacterium]
MSTVLLAILDGVAIRKEIPGNAFKQANKPNFDYFWENFPHTVLDASGLAVGLPEGQMGNSEVGHLNIGAGRVVDQTLVVIHKEIKQGIFQNNKILKEALLKTKKENKKLHVLGLLSDGGVHSHIDHIIKIVKLAKEKGIKNIYVHPFLDGRDTYYKSANTYIKKLLNTKACSIGVVAGRHYAMDRDKNWHNVKKVYDLLVKGEGPKFKTAEEGILKNYEEGNYDEFVTPFIVDSDAIIEENDTVIFANFRADRAIELSLALTDPNFKYFETKNLNLNFVTMTLYRDDINASVMYDIKPPKNTLGDYISDHGLTQLRISETTKYAHVTYFFDGGVEKDLPGATRILIDSPKVETFDLKPEMSAYEITEKLLTELDKNYDLVVLNFANGDMVGHTANMEATIKAIEAVDECLGKIYQKIKQINGLLIVTADHGNSEELLDKDGNPVTTHTTNKVPFIIVKEGIKLKDGGKLGNIAPTILELMNLEKPVEMEEDSLIKH